jgi:hypothetical protein
MNTTNCMKAMVAANGPAAIPGCLQHCAAAAWRGFVGMLRQLG